WSTGRSLRWAGCLPGTFSRTGAGGMETVPMLGELDGYLSSPSNRAKVLQLLGEHLILALAPLDSGNVLVALTLYTAVLLLRPLRRPPAPGLGAAPAPWVPRRPGDSW